MNKLKVAAVQAASAVFDAEKTLAKVEALSEQAAAGGAKLVVFPEAFVSGYPKGSDFGARVGMRTEKGRDDFRRYFESAIEVPGPATERLAELAGRLGIYLVLGVIERGSGTLYCTIVFFSPEGKLLGKHRKLMPTATERLVWGQGDGSTLSTFDTPHGTLGAVICWENYMPLLRMAMYAQNVTLYCAPTADDRDTWVPSMQHIALEGRCFVISACQCARRSDYPEDYTLDEEVPPEHILMRGGSCIVGPLGQVIAGPVFNEETILTAEIDLDDIARSRMDFDVVGHYSRPDVFSLSVDTSPKVPVRLGAAKSEGNGPEEGEQD